MSIPKEWKYEITVTPHWPFITKLPVAWIVEGTSTLQCLCPNCEYGEGYNEPLIAGQCSKKTLICQKCGTRFIGLIIGGLKEK